MRDKARIKVLLNELEELWNKTPDYRFGQLISNLDFNKTVDIFFIEDYEWIEVIKKSKNLIRGFRSDEEIYKNRLSECILIASMGLEKSQNDSLLESFILDSNLYIFNTRIENILFNILPKFSERYEDDYKECLTVCIKTIKSLQVESFTEPQLEELNNIKNYLDTLKLRLLPKKEDTINLNKFYSELNELCMRRGISMEIKNLQLIKDE